MNSRSDEQADAIAASDPVERREPDLDPGLAPDPLHEVDEAHADERPR